jgi:hypothetical protein
VPDSDAPHLSSAGSAGRWLRAGELDSPVPAGRLEEVARRRPADAAGLARSELAGGGMLVVVARVLEDLERLLAALEEDPHSGRVPLVAELAGARWTGELVTTLECAGADAATVNGGTPRALVLLRPDLLVDGGHTIDGVRLRNALWRWTREHPADLVVCLVAETSFVARDPHPETVVLRPAQPRSPEPAEPNAHATALWSALASRDPAAVTDAMYATFAAPGRDHAPGAQGELLAAVGRPYAEVCEALDPFVRSLLAGQLGTETPVSPPAAPPHAHAAAGAGAYCLLAAAYEHAPRETLTGIDLARWLCLLRSASYELTAAVALSLRGERLPHVHLVHAPPLEFADLRGCDLREADLYRVNLADADLRGADLRDADLARAHLKRADLRDADLRGADVTYASLEQADLRGARLAGADLARSFVDDAAGLDPNRD